MQHMQHTDLLSLLGSSLSIRTRALKHTDIRELTNTRAYRTQRSLKLICTPLRSLLNADGPRGYVLCI
jgi:hypothetical protein